MTDEAAKVINLSLYKMAESRTVRRAGNLHKSLLIASVLTKARSAYIEHLYLGDDDSLQPTSSSDLAPLPSISTFSNQNSSLCFDNTDSPLEDDCDISNAEMIDPSFFVEVEGEIDLPTDILKCVEKLTQITGEEIRFMNDESQASDEPVQNSDENSNEVVLSNLSNIIYSSPMREENSYDSLDSGLKQTSSNNAVSHNHSSVDSDGELFSQVQTSTKGIKRRRGWSGDDVNEDCNDEADKHTEIYDDEGYSDEKYSFEQFLPQEIKDKLKKNGVSVTKNSSKRRRLSISSLESLSEDNQTDDSLTISSVEENKENNSIRFTSSFRTRKIQFEVDEIESEEDDDDNDDSFLEEDFEQAWSSTSSVENKEDGNSKNDRRVPSASSSSSSSGSDEESESLTDGTSAMDVDQITSLVQYFTFKQQNQGNSCPPCPPTSPSSIITTTKSGGLTRSMSTPDLCSMQKSKELSSTSSNNDRHHIFGTAFNLLPVEV